MGSTKAREKTALTSEDVQGILRACGESNVARIKWGDLEVEFAPKGLLPQPKPDLTPAPAADIAAVQEKIEVSAIERDEVALRSEQLAEMILTNPAQAEELMALGELEDDDEKDAE